MGIRKWFGAAAIVLAAAGPRQAIAQEATSEPTAAREATAQETTDDERARLHFEAGRSHYERGAYDRAHEEFRLAWELSRRPVLLLNLSQTNARLARYEQAAANIEEFLRLEPDTEDAEVLRTRIENFRRLAAEQAAEETAEAEIAAEEAQPEPSDAASEPPGPRTSGPDSGMLIGSAVSLGIGGVGLALWGVFGGLVLAEDGALASGCGAMMACTQAQVADLETFSLVADVSLGIGLAGAVTGAVLVVIALTSGSSEDRAQALRWDGRGMAVRF